MTTESPVESASKRSSFVPPPSAQSLVSGPGEESINHQKWCSWTFKVGGVTWHHRIVMSLQSLKQEPTYRNCCWGTGVTSREKGRSHTNVSSPLFALLWLLLLTIIVFLWEDQQRATKLRRQSPKTREAGGSIPSGRHWSPPDGGSMDARLQCWPWWFTDGWRCV